MQVFFVTYKDLKEKKVGECNGLKCYLMGFFRYRNLKEKGFVFATAKQALNLMLKLSNINGGNQ